MSKGGINPVEYNKKSSKYFNQSKNLHMGKTLVAGIIGVSSVAYMALDFSTPPKNYSTIKNNYDSISEIIRVYENLPKEGRVELFSKTIHEKKSELELQLEKTKSTPEYNEYIKEINNKYTNAGKGVVLALIIAGLGSIGSTYLKYKGEKEVSKEQKEYENNWMKNKIKNSGATSIDFR